MSIRISLCTLAITNMSTPGQGMASGSMSAEVHSRADDPGSPVVATELVTTSISSGGDGSDMRDEMAAVLPENPHIRYSSGRRGYVRARFTADEMRADFRVVLYVSRPGAGVQTGASFVVPDRASTLHAM